VLADVRNDLCAWDQPLGRYGPGRLPPADRHGERRGSHATAAEERIGHAPLSSITLGPPPGHSFLDEATGTGARPCRDQERWGCFTDCTAHRSGARAALMVRRICGKVEPLRAPASAAGTRSRRTPQTHRAAERSPGSAHGRYPVGKGRLRWMVHPVARVTPKRSSPMSRGRATDSLLALERCGDRQQCSGSSRSLFRASLMVSARLRTSRYQQPLGSGPRGRSRTV
jgi:hypothetical protein